MNATNNGYLGFDNVRIPREQMLMKNAQVLEVRNAVIIWRWYRIMLVMHILSMHTTNVVGYFKIYAHWVLCSLTDYYKTV